MRQRKPAILQTTGIKTPFHGKPEWTVSITVYHRPDDSAPDFMAEE
jgi:hypothetical protein